MALFDQCLSQLAIRGRPREICSLTNNQSPPEQATEFLIRLYYLLYSHKTNPEITREDFDSPKSWEGGCARLNTMLMPEAYCPPDQSGSKEVRRGQQNFRNEHKPRKI
jgi:hypothetical protein